jgi:hypothetical protein
MTSGILGDPIGNEVSCCQGHGLSDGNGHREEPQAGVPRTLERHAAACQEEVHHDPR